MAIKVEECQQHQQQMQSSLAVDDVPAVPMTNEQQHCYRWHHALARGILEEESRTRKHANPLIYLILFANKL